MKDMSTSFCFRLLENSPSFIVIIDNDQTIFWLNQSFCDFLGLDREQVIGKSIENAKEPCIKQILNAKVRVELFAGVLDKWIELQDVMQVNAAFTEDAPKQEFTICYYTDASKKVQVEKQLLQLESTLSHKMSHDPVTGMLNHHSMFQTMNSEVSRSRRYHNPLSLILMNVNYSNLPGDFTDEQEEQTRLTVSQLLKDQMRWADIVGHLEGYDFVLLLPETSLDSAEVLANKLKTNMLNITEEGIQACFGISQWQKGDDVKLFLDRAADNLKSTMVDN